jgi:hypothetical protein
MALPSSVGRESITLLSVAAQYLHFHDGLLLIWCNYLIYTRSWVFRHENLSFYAVTAKNHRVPKVQPADTDAKKRTGDGSLLCFFRRRLILGFLAASAFSCA